MTRNQIEKRCSEIYHELSPDAKKAYSLYTNFSSTIDRYGRAYGNSDSSMKMAEATAAFHAYLGKNPQIRPEIERALKRAETLRRNAVADFTPVEKATTKPTRKKSSTKGAKIGLAASIVGYFVITFIMIAIKAEPMPLTLLRGVAVIGVWVSAIVWWLGSRNKDDEGSGYSPASAGITAKQKEDLAPVEDAIKIYKAILS